MVWISFLETSTRTTFFMALRSPLASDVILFPDSVTLTTVGKVETSPVGTFVSVLLLKSTESTKAAMADTFPDVINDWIASSVRFVLAHVSERWQGLMFDTWHEQGAM